MRRRGLDVLADALLRWPAARQIAGSGNGDAAVSERTGQLRFEIIVHPA